MVGSIITSPGLGTDQVMLVSNQTNSALTVTGVTTNYDIHLDYDQCEVKMPKPESREHLEPALDSLADLLEE